MVLGVPILEHFRVVWISCFSLSVECLYDWVDRYLYLFCVSGILWSSAWFIWRGDAGLRQWGSTGITK